MNIVRKSFGKERPYEKVKELNYEEKVKLLNKINYTDLGYYFNCYEKGYLATQDITLGFDYFGDIVWVDLWLNGVKKDIRIEEEWLKGINY